METKTVVNNSITIHQEPHKVWEVLTSPGYIKLWLSDTGLEAVSDFNVGSPILFTGKWHGVKYGDHGIILEFEPDKIFKYSYWTKISRLPDTFENHTYIEFRLDQAGDQTVLNLTHSNLIAEKAYEHSNFYWGITLGVIKKLAEEKF